MNFSVENFELDKFLKVNGDTGYIEIPVEYLITRFEIDSADWTASIMPTTDTTYSISGRWFIKKNR